MKRQLMGLLAVGAMLFVACSSEKDFYDPNSLTAQKEAQYEYAFMQRYGKIAPDQDWGFGKASNGMKAVRANGNIGSMDGKEWYKIIDYNDIPAPITEEETKMVFDFFDNLSGNVESVSINWSDYFIQQVYQGNTEYEDKLGQNKYRGSFMMNNLSDGTCKKIGDFNGGTCGQTTDIWSKENDNECIRKNEKGICLVQGGSTADFGYDNAVSGDNKIYNNKNFGNISIIQKVGESYYVGLQFIAKGENKNQQVDGNGKYTDWILKITPAKYKDANRIIAEDLGSIGDFDFNDAVFDVAFQSNATVVTLYAAGGTLPLFIEIGEQKKEVHELFGVSTSTMVNTGKVSKVPVIFRLPSCNEIKNVKIWVANGEAQYYLNAECGKAPQKICVPTTYEWTDEQERIDAKYPKFKDWVGNTAINWLP